MPESLLSILFVGAAAAGVIAAAGILINLENHPRPLREWRLWHGPLEVCSRCGAEVPLGWIAYRRDEFVNGFHFGIGFYDQIDGSYMMRGWGVWYGGGRCCAICDTHWPDGQTTPIRPKLFEYGRNESFGAAA